MNFAGCVLLKISSHKKTKNKSLEEEKKKEERFLSLLRTSFLWNYTGLVKFCDRRQFLLSWSPRERATVFVLASVSEFGESWSKAKKKGKNLVAWIHQRNLKKADPRVVTVPLTHWLTAFSSPHDDGIFDGLDGGGESSSRSHRGLRTFHRYFLQR